MATPPPGSRPLWILAALLSLAAALAGSWALPLQEQAKTLEEAAQRPSPSATPSQIPLEEVSPAPLREQALAEDLDQILAELETEALSAQVKDLESGQIIYQKNPQTQRVPASNLKMLVDYALLATAPQARLSTSVRITDDSRLVLVAGGDTLLVPGPSNPEAVMGHAGLETLAQETLAALKEQGLGQQEFVLDLDTSRFAGSSLNPLWAQEDIDSGFIAPVTPLAFYSHYSPDGQGQASQDRPEDAPGQVQESLIASLNRLGAAEGLSFRAGEKLSSPSQGRQLAAVYSATLAQQSALMMQESDNSLAEALGRNLSVLRGGDGSSQGAVEAIRQTLTQAGLAADYRQVDISGLSMENQLTTGLLLELASRSLAGSAQEQLALDGWPLAGYSGTLGLASRFNDADELAGRGLVRAKTGTLNSVVSLTGYAVTSSGRPLVFSVLVNDVADTAAAKDGLDRWAARLTQD